jgi:hypothetical protein
VVVVVVVVIVVVVLRETMLRQFIGLNVLQDLEKDLNLLRSKLLL